MLTPSFSLSQNDSFIFFLIKAPHAKVTETEIFIDKTEFKFYSKPYFLRLTLPAPLLETDKDVASYDIETGTFNIKIKKEKDGEHFEGLQMLTKLLAPRGKNNIQPLIEVISQDENDNTKSCDSDNDDDDFDWLVDQTPFTEVLITDAVKYGFANKKSGSLNRIQNELLEVIDLKDPETVSITERKHLRHEDEKDHFSEEHYLADLHDGSHIDDIILYKPYWQQAFKKQEKTYLFTEAQKTLMLKLPRKNYLMDKSESKMAFLSLVDIVFAYCYTYRTTEGDFDVESGWTLSKMSATLSWLETHSSLRSALITCYSRCLCYPLYRTWKLARTVHTDVAQIFSLGREWILGCLLDAHALLTDTDCRYILNDLYITDYCVWIQSVSNKKLKSLSDSILSVTLNKSDLDFDLVPLESAAMLAISENSQTKQTVSNLTTSLKTISLSTDDRDSPPARAVTHPAAEGGAKNPNDQSINSVGGAKQPDTLDGVTAAISTLNVDNQSNDTNSGQNDLPSHRRSLPRRRPPPPDTDSQSSDENGADSDEESDDESSETDTNDESSDESSDSDSEGEHNVDELEKLLGTESQEDADRAVDST